MIVFVQTNSNPATKLRTVIGSFFKTVCRARNIPTSTAHVRTAAASKTYTGVAEWVIAITAPPTAGPITDDKWKLPVFHVTARENNSRGTSCGMNAELAGHMNVRAVPLI